MKRLFLTLALVIALSVPAQADFIYADFQEGTNDHLILQDTNSGLEWLSMSVTNGMSYNQASSIDGWTHATATQLRELFTKNTTNPSYLYSTEANTYTFYTVEDIAIFQEIGAFLRGNLLLNHASLVQGLFDADAPTRAGAAYIQFSSYQYRLGIWSGTPYTTDYAHQDYIGNFLVRETVVPTPEPSTLILLGAGLFGLIGLEWRKKMLN